MSLVCETVSSFTNSEIDCIHIQKELSSEQIMQNSQPDPIALAATLPLAEKVAHKNWKVREAAYRELSDEFHVAPKDGNIYPEFASSLIKMAGDPNVAAQLSGFNAISKFAVTAPLLLVHRLAMDIGKAIAEKGMNGRLLNKKHATQALIHFVDANCGDDVIQSFAATGFRSKSPKVIVATADTIREALMTYGSSSIPVRDVESHIPYLFGHATQQVRSAGKALAAELHFWIGDPVRAVLKGASKFIVRDVEALFVENSKRGKPLPKEVPFAKRKRQSAATKEDSLGAKEEEALNLDFEVDLRENLGTGKAAPKILPDAHQSGKRAFENDGTRGDGIGRSEGIGEEEKQLYPAEELELVENMQTIALDACQALKMDSSAADEDDEFKHTEEQDINYEEGIKKGWRSSIRRKASALKARLLRGRESRSHPRC